MIDNDVEFKAVLSDLPRAAQRELGARFAEHVLALSSDTRLKNAVGVAKRNDISEDEYTTAMHAAKAASVDSYTQCGHECDWNKQAGHFVAEAVLACFRPDEPGGNSAWDAAMHARMASTCASIASGHGTANDETAEQYRMLAEFMKS